MRARMMTRYWLAGMVAALFLGGSMSCGSSSSDPAAPEEDPSGEEEGPTTGVFQGYVQDNPTVPSASGSPNSFSGTLSGKMDVEVSKDGQTWKSLGAPKDVTLPLQSTSAKLALSGNTTLDAGKYTHVRVNVNQAGFIINAGSVVNGTTLTSDVHMRMGDTGSGVAKPHIASFDLKAGTTAELIIELNVETWLTVSNLENRQVPKKDVENNITVVFVSKG